MINRYRKKPVVIEAVQWDGNNIEEIEVFCGDNCFLDHTDLVIKTLEGNHFARIGDYIIKGIQGEFYPCKPDIFIKTYDVVRDWSVEDDFLTFDYNTYTKPHREEGK